MITTSEIIVSKNHIEPLADDGFIIYKLGYISPVVDGKREARMIWGNERRPNTQLTKDWITLICRDVIAGTADSIPLNLKAYAGYTIDSLTLQTDNGTLTVTVKINGTAITGLSGISATTTITETTATALKTVAVGDLVTIEWSTAYTGTPTTIYTELNMTR